MNITKILADHIIEEIKDIIPQDLNFINKEGIIISSTDENRINTFHQAAKISAITKKEIIIDRDSEYKGTRKGINMPVFLNDEVVGVIGITGEKQKVEKYASLLKKMTEILVKEQRIKENQIQTRDKYRNLIESIIYDDNIYEYFNYYGLISNNKIFAVSDAIDLNNHKVDQILQSIGNALKNEKTYYAVSQRRIIIIFLSNDINYIKSILINICNKLEERNNLQVYFGLSNIFIKLNEAKPYFSQAKSVADYASQLMIKNRVILYSNLYLGILLMEISEDKQKEFSDKVLLKIPQEEINIYNELIYYFSKYNGSITKIASKIYVNKNTVQYRIKKLKRLTGYDLRQYDDYIILKLAFLLRRYLYSIS